MDCIEIITECKAINMMLSSLLRNRFPIQEMINRYTKFSQDKHNVIPKTVIGIWNKYEDVAGNYDEMFKNYLGKKTE